MTRLRLVAAAGTLLLVLSGTAAAVISAMPLELPVLGAQAGATTLEVRLAELQPGPGLSEAVLDGSGQRVYMRADAIVTRADIASATVVEGGGRYSVNVSFSLAAGNRLAEATKSHVGRPIAIVLDGKVISAPTLRSVIRGSAVISGDFTRADAERIASGLRPAGAVPGGQAFKTSDPGVSMPAVVTEVRPRYTQAAMDAKIQGDVQLSVVVRADGSVGDVAVTQSLDAAYGLDEAAMEAARQWTFRPGTKDGTPVDVEVTLSFRFTLA